MEYILGFTVKQLISLALWVWAVSILSKPLSTSTPKSQTTEKNSKVLSGIFASCSRNALPDYVLTTSQPIAPKNRSQSAIFREKIASDVLFFPNLGNLFT